MGGRDGGLRDRPEHGWQADVVEAVLRTEVFADRHAQALLIWLTDAALTHPLPTGDSEDRITEMLRCVRLVRHCDHLPGGLRALAEAIRLLEPDGESARQVTALVEEREATRRSRAAPHGAGTPCGAVVPGGTGVGEVRPDSFAQADTRPRPVGRKDFFVSYAAADQRWAVWIAWELEAAGFSVLVQEWDFVPGSNWQLGMERGATECERVMAVLSPDYLESVHGRLEWQTAQGSDPTGFARRLVPVRIAPCRPPGMLATLVFIDLVGLTLVRARKRLLDGVDGARAGRSKPAVPPGFPG
jgi:hypothetical protein